MAALVLAGCVCCLPLQQMIHQIDAAERYTSGELRCVMGIFGIMVFPQRVRIAEHLHIDLK